MVNNAGVAVEGSAVTGVGGIARLHNIPAAIFDQTMSINTRGVFLGCKYAITQMLNQEPLPANGRGDQTRGWIVNMASILGNVALTGAPSYTVSKHAVMGITKQVAVDYAKDRIHCNSICPGCKSLV